ncbi:MAG: hypothetical protein M3Q11_06325 [Pseudomonadota bacterium]|jgi:hypothetical protein|nr:hypothetical protein [Pseudomonadota bacterium]
MKNVDELIGRALSEEDLALLSRHAEPGYLGQAVGLFRGPLAWVMWLVYVLGFVAFAGAAYALWQMAAAADALSAVKWGVAALFLFQFTTLAKSFMGNHMETNRLLRELKRVQLQVSLSRAAGQEGGESR